MATQLPTREDSGIVPTYVDAQVRLLLLDDNRDLREYVARLLRRWWSTDAVSDVAAAMEAARRQRPTLVLADAATRGRDGITVREALQRDPVTRSIPIIVLSDGGTRDLDTLEGHDCLVKPFSSRELIGHVSMRLEQLLGRPVRTQRPVRKLLNQIALPIAIVRDDTCVVENANHAYLDLIGGPDGIGKPFAERIPKATDVAREVAAQVLTTGTNDVTYELILPQSRDGRLTDTHWSFVFTRVNDEGGLHSRHVVAIGVDVTDDVRARHTREAVAAAAISANMAKDQFLAALGHELRNPLSPILTGLQLMRTRGVSCHELDVIDRQVAAIRRLVDDLLDVSRIGRGQIELRKESIEIADVVARAIETVDPLLKERQQPLSVLVPARGLRANVDSARMAQVFANLITNAAKYSERGSEITVQATRDERRLHVSVKDHGIGIASEMLPRVFEAFAQERSAARRSRGGLGLGLAIVQHLVTLHEGVVTARSDGLGSGATFSVALPLDDANLAARNDQFSTE